MNNENYKIIRYFRQMQFLFLLYKSIGRMFVNFENYIMYN